MTKTLGVALFTLLLLGCSSKQLYQVGQDYQKSECIKKAITEAQHLSCLQTEKKPFKEYKKEREDVLKK